MGSLRVLNRHLRVFHRTWQHNIMFNVIEPLLYLWAMGFGLGAFVQQMDGVSYLQFIAPGMVALAAMYSATFECTYGTFLRLQYQKTFQAMLAAPVTARDVIIGEILYGTLKSCYFRNSNSRGGDHPGSNQITRSLGHSFATGHLRGGFCGVSNVLYSGYNQYRLFELLHYHGRPTLSPIWRTIFPGRAPCHNGCKLLTG